MCGLGPGGLEPVPLRIDPHEDRLGRHVVPGVEEDLLRGAAHLGGDLHQFLGLERAERLHLIDDVAGNDRGGANGQALPGLAGGRGTVPSPATQRHPADDGDDDELFQALGHQIPLAMCDRALSPAAERSSTSGEVETIRVNVVFLALSVFPPPALPFPLPALVERVVLVAGRMAPAAPVEVRDSLFAMLSLDTVRGVLVAAGAGIVLQARSRRMAVRSPGRVVPVEPERLVVVEGRGLPPAVPRHGEHFAAGAPPRSVWQEKQSFRCARWLGAESRA